jgi:hypothetical protein
VLEHRSRGCVPLISHPYNDSSAAYLGTAILTILCFEKTRNTTTSLPPFVLYVRTPCDTDSMYSPKL